MRYVYLIFIMLIVSVCFAQSAENIQPRESVEFTRAGEVVVEPPTLICAGFQWKIEGDANRNASVAVDFRKKGESAWKAGLPLLRIGGEKIYGHEQPWVYTTPHMFAGSIFNLSPATDYECRLQLSDPDGIEGDRDHIVTFQKKAEPKT